MSKDRILWADSAKALGLVLVFLGHFIETQGYAGHALLLQVYRHIYSFHIPFFFLLAGFFFSYKPRRFGLQVLQKVRTRLVPVVFFVAMAMPFWMVPKWWGIMDVTPPQLLQLNWLLLQGKPIANWPSWFLVCLFIVELEAFELLPFLASQWKLLLSIPVIYGFAQLATTHVAQVAQVMGFAENWWFLQESLMALFFYVTGHALAQYGAFLLPTANRLRSLLMATVFLLLLVLGTHYLFGDSLSAVNMSSSAHGDWRWFPLASLSGSLMLIHIASCLPANGVLDYIGRNTLPLIGFCGLFYRFFNPLIWSYLPLVPDAMLMVIAVGISVASLLASLPFVYLLNRFVPFLVGTK